MNILLLDAHEGDREQALRSALEPALPGPVRIERASHGDPRDRLSEALAKAEVVVTQAWPPATPPAPPLRLLQLPGAGYDAIDLAAVPPGAWVCNVYEHEIGIAEYIVLGLLEWEIGLRRMDAALRAGEWRDGFVLGAPLHGELQGRTVGFIGYGHIAQAAARRLAPFGTRLMTRTRTPERARTHARESGLTIDAGGMDDLQSLLEQADYVVVTCPLTEETRGLLGRAELARMGPRTVLVNVARGPIVDEEALWEACRAGRIGGAIIDTWYRYPDPARGPGQGVRPSRFPFHELDNVIMTPHASGWSRGLLQRRWRVIGENILRLARGEPPVNVIRPPAGDAEPG